MILALTSPVMWRLGQGNGGNHPEGVHGIKANIKVRICMIWLRWKNEIENGTPLDSLIKDSQKGSQSLDGADVGDNKFGILVKAVLVAAKGRQEAERRRSPPPRLRHALVGSSAASYISVVTLLTWRVKRGTRRRVSGERLVTAKKGLKEFRAVSLNFCRWLLHLVHEEQWFQSPRLAEQMVFHSGARDEPARKAMHGEDALVYLCRSGRRVTLRCHSPVAVECPIGAVSGPGFSRSGNRVHVNGLVYS